METINEQFIAPIKQQWIDNVCSMARIDSFPDIPERIADEMINEVRRHTFMLLQGGILTNATLL